MRTKNDYPNRDQPKLSSYLPIMVILVIITIACFKAPCLLFGICPITEQPVVPEPVPEVPVPEIPVLHCPAAPSEPSDWCVQYPPKSSLCQSCNLCPPDGQCEILNTLGELQIAFTSLQSIVRGYKGLQDAALEVTKQNKVLAETGYGGDQLNNMTKSLDDWLPTVENIHNLQLDAIDKISNKIIDAEKLGSQGKYGHRLYEIVLETMSLGNEKMSTVLKSIKKSQPFPKKTYCVIPATEQVLNDVEVMPSSKEVAIPADSTNGVLCEEHGTDAATKAILENINEEVARCDQALRSIHTSRLNLPKTPPNQTVLAKWLPYFLGKLSTFRGKLHT